MARNYTNIIPECYVDTNLIQTLLRVEGVNHQSTCSQVAKGLMKITKHKDSLNNKDLTKLFKKLRDAKEMTILRETIEYLIQNPYTADEVVLKKFFCNNG